MKKLTLALIFLIVPLFADEVPDQDLDVPYEPSHPKVVEAMIKAAAVTGQDTLFDLGCGDGRIVIAAAKLGARAIGYDIDEQRLMEARERAHVAGVESKVEFRREDIFKADLSKATVVTMYLLDEINLQMRPRLFRMLKPGTRVVTHAFHMSDWKPDSFIENERARDHKIMYWVIPASAGGTWTWKAGGQDYRMDLIQKFQVVTGTIRSGNSSANIETKINGKSFTVDATLRGGKETKVSIKGMIDGDRMTGNVETAGVRSALDAKRTLTNPEGKWRIEMAETKKVFSGNLTLVKDAAGWTAEFEADKRYAITDLYVWGDSVYFRVPILGAENPAIYTGRLQNEGTGFLTNDAASFTTSFTVKKAAK
ncbi:MAG TPA: class I SAM-dependent methyltransferase [Leptospiraceae bacterium]|nr:class I SAM-dependent methyltransferase [Leptospirales bacterium]HMU85918.1 class I SAM-dependent methyltransferase [Leptospiraceae bacterium]HMX56878.1 class I SAM-dependent methyltransferase [Leptospiraceae bacterium]HNE22792.1 class I SAM-dependent methyltransferase [Leptospiraceae bacterium]HNJ03635.1 class I SAM-dependent methyltransferase [Leptospiraceae bacterium]